MNSPNHEKETNDDLLTPADLAAYLGWSPRFIDGLARGGKIPSLDRDGRTYFRRGSVIEWLEQKLYTLDTPLLTQLDAKLEDDLLAEGIFRRPRPDRLASRLPIEGIALNVEATDKPGALKSLVNLADATGLVYQRDTLLAALLDREALCSTAMPGGLAICHPRHRLPDAIEKEFVCLLRTKHPIDFGAEDGSATDLFFLLCAPDEKSHLHGLARLSRILTPGVVAQLRAVVEPADALNLFLSGEESLAATTP